MRPFAVERPTSLAEAIALFAAGPVAGWLLQRYSARILIGGGGPKPVAPVACRRQTRLRSTYCRMPPLR